MNDEKLTKEIVEDKIRKILEQYCQETNTQVERLNFWWHLNIPHTITEVSMGTKRAY